MARVDLGTAFFSGGFPGGQTAITTGAGTTVNGCLAYIVAAIQGDPTFSGTDWSTLMTPSNSGTALTWTRQINQGDTGEFGGGIAIWTAPVAVGASTTFTVTRTTSVTCLSMFIAAGYYTNYDTVTPVGATGSKALATDGADSLTLSGTPAATSEVLGGRFGAVINTGTCLAAPGTSHTEFADLSHTDTAGMQAQVQDIGTASTTFAWADVSNGTASGSPPLSSVFGVAIEIRAAPAAAAANAAQDRTRDRTANRALKPIQSRTATRGRDRAQRSQFDLYRAASATASADISVVGLLPVGALLVADVSHAASIAGILPLGATPVGLVSHDATVAGILPVGVVPVATVSHAANVVGILPLGAVQVAITRLDVPTIGILPVGATLVGSIAHDALVAGILPVGAVPVATISHDAAVAGILPVGASLIAPVAHNASVAGILPVGAVLIAVVTGATDISVVGVLTVGASLVAPVSHQALVSGVLPLGTALVAPVSRTTTVAGILPVGLSLIGDVTHRANVIGILPVGATLYALYTVTGPDTPDLHPILFIYREPAQLQFTEGPRLIGRDVDDSYREGS